MGFRVRDAKIALQYVTLKGATPYQPLDEQRVYELPAIYGVGNTLIYFVDYKNGAANYAQQFSNLPNAESSANVSLTDLNHVTHNLYRGNMIKWADFYTRLFNFYEDATQGKASELNSMALTSPCGKIRLPLHESSDDESPIETFLNHFNGEGIQQIALGTEKKDIAHWHWKPHE